MKIHSKFQDYYDSALAHGVDTSHHWIRNVKEKSVTVRHNGYYSGSKPPGMHKFFESDLYLASPLASSDTSPGNRYIRTITSNIIYVGFCGKVYPALRFHWGTDHNLKEIIHTAYSADDVVKILAEYDVRDKTTEKHDFLNPPKEKRNRWHYTINELSTDWNYNDVDKFFKEFSASDQFFDMFIDENVPIWVMDKRAVFINKKKDHNKGVLYTNPQLSQYDFQKVMDPYTAMQEIDMFLYGVLGNGNPDIIEPEDKYRIAGHGFTECSFRKAPTKRKGKCAMKGKK